MRRWILTASSAVALVAAMAIGPLGTAAAAPYVYGCTPASLDMDSPPLLTYPVLLTVYNGSASTANLTLKVLAGNGTLVNNAMGVPVNHTLVPTHTHVVGYSAPYALPSESNHQIPASVRIVSNVPVSATLTHNLTNADWKPIVCTPQQP